MDAFKSNVQAASQRAPTAAILWVESIDLTAATNADRILNTHSIASAIYCAQGLFAQTWLCPSQHRSEASDVQDVDLTGLSLVKAFQRTNKEGTFV